MPEHRYIFEPYKGKDTRHDCPQCGKRNEFTRYIYAETGEHLAPNVGICNRKIECGYHYPPKQYFEDNRHLLNTFQPKQHSHTKATPILRQKPITYVPVELFKTSLKRYEENNLVKFFCSKFGNEITTALIEKYFIGTSKHWGKGASIFWEIDISGKIRTGKIMLYALGTGKRVKEPFDHFYWVHNDFKQYNLKQCLFGEHLLKETTKPVFIFESEKTAIIASVYFPDFICLACGGFDGLNPDKCKVLQGRNIILYPDLSKPDAKRNCFVAWSDKAKEFNRLFPGSLFNVSGLLEHKATETEREQGLDLADYLIRFNFREFQQPEQTKTLQPELKLPQPKELLNEQELPLTPEPILLNNPDPPEPEGWRQEITDLERYFETATLPPAPVQLNAWTTITDIPQFIHSHLAEAKSYNIKRFALPCLNRLQELKQYITKKSGV